MGRHDLDDDAAALVRDVMAGCGARDELHAVAEGAARTAQEFAREHLPTGLADYLCALADEMARRGQ